MSDSALVDNATSYSIPGPPDADTAGKFRKQLRRWLNDTVSINAQQVADVVLASYEALSNCAEHAYCDHGSASGGLLTLDTATTVRRKLCKSASAIRAAGSNPAPPPTTPIEGGD